MNEKITIKTVALTFCIAWVLEGCILFANQFGYLKFGTPLCMVLIYLGAMSPTIIAFMVLTKNKVMTAKQFFKTVFAVKQPVLMYFLVIGFVAVYFGTSMITKLFEYNSFDYISLLLLPLTLVVAGGLEEVVWRFGLNPALERKLPFVVACLITGVIWSIWHLPLFYIENSWQSDMNFFIFSIGSIGLAFAFAAIYRVSKSVWLCVFIHALNNALGGSFTMYTYNFNTAVIPVTIVAVVLIIASILTVTITEKYKGNILKEAGKKYF